MRPTRCLLVALGAVLVLAAPGSAHRVHLACIDGCLRGGDPACDIDGNRDGVCTFALCPYRCSGRSPCIKCPVPVAVPLGKSVVKTPGLKFVLRCLAKDEVACLVPPTTTSTTTTIPLHAAQLTALVPDVSDNTFHQFLTLSLMGCEAVFPLGAVVLGQFTCEPSFNCPTSTGIGRLSISEIGPVSAEADFLDGSICTFLSPYDPPITEFSCKDATGNLLARGSFAFDYGEHPPCATEP